MIFVVRKDLDLYAFGKFIRYFKTKFHNVSMKSILYYSENISVSSYCVNSKTLQL